jgi:hypothetical protein
MYPIFLLTDPKSLPPSRQLPEEGPRPIQRPHACIFTLVLEDAETRLSSGHHPQRVMHGRVRSARLGRCHRAWRTST